MEDFQAQSVPIAMEARYKSEEELQDNGVGVLGWLGFTVINFAAWGIIGVSTALAWPLGFTFTIVYTGLLMSLATCLPRYGSQYRSFENLLWVLGCVFVFVAGMYLSINVVGPAFEVSNDGGYHPPPTVDNDLAKFLPQGSVPELVSWAKANPSWAEMRDPTVITFQGNVFFGGLSNALHTSADQDDILLKSDGTTIQKITPEIRNFRGLVHFNSNMYFLGDSDRARNALWEISPSATDSAVLVKEFEKGSTGWASVEHLKVIDGKMWMKVSKDCRNGDSDHYKSTVYQSDGTTSGTIDLRGDSCVSDQDDGDDDEGNQSSNKPTATLVSILFLADIPQMVVAGAILAWKKMPGLFVNLYVGFAVAANLIYIIAWDVDEDFGTFFKWFITIYTSIAYIVITFLSLRFDPLPEQLEKMKDWIVVFVGIPFFVIIHVDLNLPFDASAGEWILYGILAFLQMLISIAIQRSLPMVLGSIATFVLAWKISREIARASFGDEMNETALLVILGLMGLQGIGIIGGAIVYATKRKQIEEAVRESWSR